MMTDRVFSVATQLSYTPLFRHLKKIARTRDKLEWPVAIPQIVRRISALQVFLHLNDISIYNTGVIFKGLASNTALTFKTVLLYKLKQLIVQSLFLVLRQFVLRDDDFLCPKRTVR
jgi:hypothetical protein